MEKFVLIFMAFLIVDRVSSHGRLMDPPSRSSAWRIGWPTPHNYDDNALYCGGFARMQNNGGKCGICGDPYDGPRLNEAGGKYATGTIFKKYKRGAIISAKTDITANHCGHMQFKICPNNNVNKVATQECLDKNVLQMADGSGNKFKVPCGQTGTITVNLKLPEHLVCSQCVVQWKYHAGNSWGVDPITKRGCVGCGAQEEFYGCSDVAIEQSDAAPLPQVPVQVPTTPRPTPRPTTRLVPRVTKGQTNPVFIGGGNPTQAPAIKPQIGQNTGSNCRAINNWAGSPTLDKWCADNCAAGNCPALACDCSGPPALTNPPPTTQKPTTPKPTTTTPKPTTTTRMTQKPTTRAPVTTVGPYYITRTECKAINLWAGNEYLDRFCADTCARGDCPEVSCACTKTQVLVTRPTEETLIPFFGTNAPGNNQPTTGAVVNTVKVCKAVSEWAGIEVFNTWCTNECNRGHCPESTCSCVETPVQPVTTARPTPKPTTAAPTTTKPTTTTPKPTTTTPKPTTTTRPTTTAAPVPGRIANCKSNGIVGGEYWDSWCQDNCDRGYCAQDYCNCA